MEWNQHNTYGMKPAQHIWNETSTTHMEWNQYNKDILLTYLVMEAFRHIISEPR